MPITSGTVTYGQTLNTGDYNSKKAEASFGFVVKDNASEEEAKAAGDIAGKLATGKVQELLGLAPAPTTGAKRGPKPKAPESAPVAAAPAAAPATSKVDPTAIGEIETVTLPLIRTSPENRVDPTQVEDDDLLSGSAPEITDKELSDAVTKKKVELSKSLTGNLPVQLIKKVIGKYVGTAQMVTMQQESRAAFLEELKALKPE